MKSTWTPRKVLVPCGGSKPSANALMKGVELFTPPDDASIKQTEIILMRAVPYIEVPLPLDESGMIVAESRKPENTFSR